MKGQRLQVVDKFTYLGSTLSRVVHIDDEVNARIAKAFGRLRGSIWDRSWIRLDTKLKVYRSVVVLPTLLYACEAWTVDQRHTKRLNHFHTSSLRKLLKIRHRSPDTEVLKRAGMQSVHTLLKLALLRWTGHVTRISDECLPKKILYGELQVGKHSHGGQKKWYKDTFKASLKDVSIPTESWEQIAQDRTKWRGLIRRGAGEYEAKRISEAEQKRAQRKVRAKASPTELSSSDLSCSICNRQFRAKIGLISHLRTQNNNTSHNWLGLVIVSNDWRTSFTSEIFWTSKSKSLNYSESIWLLVYVILTCECRKTLNLESRYKNTVRGVGRQWGWQWYDINNLRVAGHINAWSWKLCGPEHNRWYFKVDIGYVFLRKEWETFFWDTV